MATYLTPVSFNAIKKPFISSAKSSSSCSPYLLVLAYLPDEDVEDVVDVPPVRGRRLHELAAELGGQRGALLRAHAPLALQVDLVAHQDDGNVLRGSHLEWKERSERVDEKRLESSLRGCSGFSWRFNCGGLLM